MLNTYKLLNRNGRKDRQSNLCRFASKMQITWEYYDNLNVSILRCDFLKYIEFSSSFENLNVELDIQGVH